MTTTFSVTSPNYHVTLHHSPQALWTALRCQEMCLEPKSTARLTQDKLATALAAGGTVDLFPHSRARWRYRVQTHRARPVAAGAAPSGDGTAPDLHEQEVDGPARAAGTDRARRTGR